MNLHTSFLDEREANCNHIQDYIQIDFLIMILLLKILRKLNLFLKLQIQLTEILE